MNKNKSQTRREQLIPKGIPRYIRAFDSPEYLDRYTVIFTKKANTNSYGERWFIYVGMRTMPFHPQGFGQHGEMDDPRGGKHLGKRIPFSALPVDCQTLVMNDYKDIWGII